MYLLLKSTNVSDADDEVGNVPSHGDPDDLDSALTDGEGCGPPPRTIGNQTNMQLMNRRIRSRFSTVHTSCM